MKMPRTKQIKSVVNSQTKDELLKCLRDKEISILKQLDDEDNIYQNMEQEHELIMKLMMNSFDKYLNVRLSDLKSVDISTAFSAISMTEKRDRPKLKRSISDSAINKSNILLLQSKASTISTGSDSGNSTSSNASRSTSRSALRSGNSGQTTATSKRSRSLSRNKKRNAPFNIGRSTIRPLLPITPKIRSCGVIPAIMRRPKQNEIAVSLQGSPLMVTANTDGINANIPLPDGRVIALQPTNMRLSEIADLSLEPESISDLQQLRDNLIKLCENVKNKSKK